MMLNLLMTSMYQVIREYCCDIKISDSNYERLCFLEVLGVDAKVNRSTKHEELGKLKIVCGLWM